jgi:hypothetical protein
MEVREHIEAFPRKFTYIMYLYINIMLSKINLVRIVVVLACRGATGMFVVERLKFYSHES